MKKLIMCWYLFSTPWYIQAMKIEYVSKPGGAFIYECDSMRNMVTDVSNHLAKMPQGEKAVAIIDLDFTLVMASDPQGHPRYFRALVKFLQENRHMSEAEARSRVLLEIFGSASHLTTIQRDGYDEGPDARRLLTLFHTHHIPIFAVTARSTILSKQTMRALHELGFVFSKPIEQIELNKKEYPFLEDDARFVNGILFCGKNKKGMLTRHLIHCLGLCPTTIFAIDDDIENLETIASAMRTIPTTIGYRYGFLDQEIHDFAFTPDIIPPWAWTTPSTAQSVDTFSGLASPTSPGPNSCPSTKMDNEEGL